MSLTTDLYQIQQRNEPITMNCMITTSLLYHKNEGEISFKSIKDTTHEVFEHILAKGYKTYCSARPENYDINLAVKHLGLKVIGKPLDKHKGSEAKVLISLDKKMLALAYYSSQMTTHFAMESIIAHAVSYLTNFDHPTQILKTTTIDEAFEHTKFVQSIFISEFLNHQPLRSRDEFVLHISEMEKVFTHSQD
jgi:hypothetical protein